MRMRQTEDRQLGVAGQTAVTLFFEELGWAATSFGEQDLGTDILLHIRDEKLMDSSLFMGAQVKTGSSYFKSKGEVDGRKGYWYSESNMKHANYWANSSYPNIIVLQSEDKKTKIWNYTNWDTIVRTGKGFKIFVPEDQHLDSIHVSDWIASASKLLKRVFLEGSQWDFSPDSISENDQAAYALLVPRLVAPHPNKGFSQSIKWYQAVALCVQAHSHQWDRFAEKHLDVPTPQEALNSGVWGWRFAGAVYAWTYQNDISQLEDLEFPPNRSHGVALSIFLSIALVEMGRSSEALKELTSRSKSDEHSAEQGWINVHRARILIEKGDLEEGRKLAELANIQVNQVPGNVVVSAIKAAVAWTLFETANWDEREVSSIALALDNMSSWWRTQTMATGLQNVVQEQFKLWARDKDSPLSWGNDGHNSLFSSALMAQLAGSHGQWKSCASLLAMTDLSISDGDETSVFNSLNLLRRTGNKIELELAIKKIRHIGPLGAFTKLVSQVSPLYISLTSIRTDLGTIKLVGDYCTPNLAESLLDFLLDTLEGNNSDLSKFSRTFDLEIDVIEALWGLMFFADARTEDRIIQYVVNLSDNPNRVLEHPLNLLSSRLSEDARNRNREAIEAKASSVASDSWFGWYLVNLVGVEGEFAGPLIREGLLKGIPSAMESIKDVNGLQEDEVAAIFQKCVVEINIYHGEAHLGTRGIGLQDWAHTYAVTAIHFPQLADWSVINNFLADVEILIERKRNICKYLAKNQDKIPSNARVSLINIVSVLRSASKNKTDFFGLLPEIGGAVDEMYLRLVGVEHTDHQRVLGTMLVGDIRTRLDAIEYLASRSGFENILLSLTSDQNEMVRNQAVKFLAQRVAKDDDLDSGYLENLKTLALTGGDSVIVSILNGFATIEPRSNRVREFVRGYRSHPSKQIRNHIEEYSLDSKSS